MTIDKKLLSSPSLANFFEMKEDSLLIEGLWDGPKAALLSLLFKAKKKNILVITSDKSENRLVDNLS